jgi:hypothetical protein
VSVPRVSLDFETFSAGPSVKDVGPAKYAEHPTTEVLCLAWALGDAEPSLWVPGERFPRELFQLIDAGAHLFAWNAEFELAVWAEQCHRRMGWPAVPFESWRDTAAVALTFGLPASLEDAGAALRLAIQKDPRGSRLLGKLSKPRKVSKLNPATRWTPATAPDDFAALYAYCRQDVRTEREIGRVLPRRDLPPLELTYWRATVEMNSRGWAVDVDSARRMIAMLAEHRAALLLELQAVTDGVVTSDGQRDRILSWLAARDVFPKAKKKGENELTPSMAADAVAEALRGQIADPAARRVLEIRQELGKSSVKKYGAMVERCCADGTVKNNILYHGAGTGRDAGRGLQIQNFPRASVARKKGTAEEKDHDIQRAFDALRSENPLETVDFLYGNPAHFASKMLRSHLVAAPGQRLYGADFSSIENRITVWYAQDRHGIELFVRGLDQYRDFASGHFGVAYDDVTDDQRQEAKPIVLGCFAAETPILTDRGWVPIVDVKPGDQLWDGVEWVGHGGLVDQGQRETVWLDGVRATPNHEILTPAGWSTAGRLARVESAVDLSLAIDMAASWLPDSNGAPEAEFSPSRSLVIVGTREISTTGACTPADLVNAATAGGSKQPEPFDGTDMGKLCPTTRTGRDGAAGTPRCSADATIRRAELTASMAPGEFESASSGTTEPNSSGRFSGFPAGITQPSKSTELTPTRTTGRGMSGWQPDKRTSRIVVRVFDLLDAGPRRRFTILTNTGPLIAHNCCFQMGVKTFMDTCARQGKPVTLEVAQRAVTSYREQYPGVVGLWSGLERAAIQAVKYRQPSRYLKIGFEFTGDFLYMILAGGRKIAYYRPKVQMAEMPWKNRDGSPARREALTCMCADEKTRVWSRRVVRPGRLTENAVQGTARDVMMHGSLATAAAGYDLVGRVHDELISTRADGTGSVDEYTGLMVQKPSWLDEIPISAEGWSGARYQK